FQLGMFDKERIEPDEIVFSAIPNLDKLVHATFPEIRGFIKAKRSINLVSTGEILTLEKGRKILVVGDHEDVTRKIIQELLESRFDHHYIPFYPGLKDIEDIDCAVTTGEVELVPDTIDHVINIGLRVISLKTMMEVNEFCGLGLSNEEINRQYILSLVYVSSNWPISRKNKYISTWIGTKQDDHPDQSFKDFISQSKAMQSFIQQAKALSNGRHPVHIDGAIGVGKRRVAIAIHNESPFAPNKFFCINCTSESDSLEKNLFGWEAEGAVYPGLLETAQNGTVCIEEIDYMPQSLQEKLATFLTDHVLVRSGGTGLIRVQTRLLTTGTIPLIKAFKSKKIRQSLYHHLSLHICTMPSLSQRRDDFDLLIHKFLVRDLNRPDLTIGKSALQILKAYTWEGNVQEFYNVLFHLACLDEKKITKNMLPFYIYRETQSLPRDEDGSDIPNTDEIIQRIEKSGFLDEHLEILDIYFQGKKENHSFGRAVVIEYLKERGLLLTKQKLRLRQERLNDLGLLNVMKGRAGTTISRTGELFLKEMEKRKQP
ncbi:MAG: sigma-54-dependent Fis family transcriptional regulator, partial [Desulfobacteraceae bacterium]|nr:sigma-54-dependent Fis family transcriptional regulator [Desulfobacteraceae bacterium]